MQGFEIHLYCGLVINEDVLAIGFGYVLPPATIEASTHIKAAIVKDAMDMFVVV
jgi:hypothetical protein